MLEFILSLLLTAIIVVIWFNLLSFAMDCLDKIVYQYCKKKVNKKLKNNNNG